MRNAAPPPPPEVLLFIIPLLFTLGALVLFLFSRTSGWSTLASRYRTEMEPPESIEYVIWASVDGMSFNNVLSVAGIPQGLYLKASFPSYPPLLIPWAEIRRRTRSQFLGLSRDLLEIGGERPVRIQLSSDCLQPFEHYLPVLS
jgi:hypothetical protein